MTSASEKEKSLQEIYFILYLVFFFSKRKKNRLPGTQKERNSDKFKYRFAPTDEMSKEVDDDPYYKDAQKKVQYFFPATEYAQTPGNTVSGFKTEFYSRDEKATLKNRVKTLEKWVFYCLFREFRGFLW